MKEYINETWFKRMSAWQQMLEIIRRPGRYAGWRSHYIASRNITIVCPPNANRCMISKYHGKFIVAPLLKSYSHMTDNDLIERLEQGQDSVELFETDAWFLDMFHAKTIRNVMDKIAKNKEVDYEDKEQQTDSGGTETCI